MKRQFILTCFLLLTSAGITFAQSRSDLRINEALINNVGNYQDDFGRHGAWIEIFNSSYGTVDVGGCYLTNDPANLKMYPIPRGDVLTKISPRQHTLFWADNRPTDGTFHLNFTLDSVRRFVALVSNDGSTIIDSITLPASLASLADQSYGRAEDGKAQWRYFVNTTPSSNNKLRELEAVTTKFKENDPRGIAMSITAVLVVFTALTLLFFAFSTMGKVIQKRFRRREAAHTGIEKGQAHTIKTSSSDVYAAIAFAIHKYQQDLRTIEKTVLTINKVARAYSPWSSKIYGLRETPVKKQK